MNTAVEVTHLSQTFTTRAGKVEAVRDVSFAINQGEIVALLGENGAGKSTLIDMMLGLSSPTAGTVELMGTTPSRAVLNSQVSAVLQTGGLLKGLSVKDQVAMVAATYSKPPRVNTALEAAGILDISDRKIAKCSGGQQQKVKFAIALLGDPDILFLDEPTAGMDVNARESFWTSMRQQTASGKTIIFATHYLEEAQDFADRTIMMAHGKLVADGPTESIRAGAGLRTVTFRADEDIRLLFDSQQLETWGIRDLVQEGSHISLQCVDVEDLLKHLLTHVPIKQLEVRQPSLADAFSRLSLAN